MRVDIGRLQRGPVRGYSHTVSDKILVIKLGALGDFVQAAGPFSTVREHHHRSTITLLTTEPFAEFAVKSPWFDQVWIDRRPKLLNIPDWLSLRSQLLGADFSRVYDLQTSNRSSHYFKLFWPHKAPEWSGIAGGCSHPHANPKRDFMHTLERQAEQLEMAGLSAPPVPDFSWVQSDLSRFGLTDRFAVLAPGGAPHRPDKRWPAASCAELAAQLEEDGLQPVVIGMAAEKDLGDEVVAECESGLNLAGETSLEDLFLLARQAECAIGNDTGPMHIFAAEGCRTLVLYSNASDPAFCAQRGDKVNILRRESLGDLSVKDVTAALATGTALS